MVCLLCSYNQVLCVLPHTENWLQLSELTWFFLCINWSRCCFPSEGLTHTLLNWYFACKLLSFKNPFLIFSISIFYDLESETSIITLGQVLCFKSCLALLLQLCFEEINEDRSGCIVILFVYFPVYYCTGWSVYCMTLKDHRIVLSHLLSHCLKAFNYSCIILFILILNKHAFWNSHLNK